MPQLDLIKMPRNHSESDITSDSEQMDCHFLNEDSKTGGGKQKRGPNPRQIKKIMDKYNIVSCNRKEWIKQIKGKDELKISVSHRPSNLVLATSSEKLPKLRVATDIHKVAQFTKARDGKN